MKTRTFIAVSALLMVAFILIGGGSKKEISIEEAMNALCHTWTNPGGPGADKDVYNHDGTYELYHYVDSAIPSWRGTFKIEEAWSDREGNIWIIAWPEYLGDSKVLYKFSNSGTIIELIRYNEDTSPVMEGKEFAYMRCLPSYKS